MNLYDLQDKIAQKAYNDPDYMKALKDNPRQILMQESGLDIPEELEIELVVSKPGELNLGLPVNTQQLSEQNLDEISGGIDFLGILKQVHGVVKDLFGGTVDGWHKEWRGE